MLQVLHFEIKSSSSLHVGPIHDFSRPSQASLNTNMGSVELLFDLGSQARRDDALWTLENDTILSSQLVSDVEVVAELCR